MYHPEFKGPIEGWTVNYTKTHFWRIENSMEFQDALQEAYLVYLRCVKRYAGKTEAKHFMSLYKQAWARQLHDLSKTASMLRNFVGETHEYEDGQKTRLEPIGETDNAGMLAITLAQAPEEVRKVLALMLSAPQEMLDILLADWRGHDVRRLDGGGSRINAALGLPKNTDAIGAVHRYLSQ